MSNVTNPCEAKRLAKARAAAALKGCRDPAALLEELDRIEAEFGELAKSQPTDAEQRAFLEMAARVRAASKDVGRLVRDVTG